MKDLLLIDRRNRKKAYRLEAATGTRELVKPVAETFDSAQGMAVEMLFIKPSKVVFGAVYVEGSALKLQVDSSTCDLLDEEITISRQAWGPIKRVSIRKVGVVQWAGTYFKLDLDDGGYDVRDFFRWLADDLATLEARKRVFAYWSSAKDRL